MASPSSSDYLIQALKKDTEKLQTYMEMLQTTHILPVYEKAKTSLTVENEHTIKDFPMRMFEGHLVNKERERYTMMKQRLSEVKASLVSAGFAQKRRLQQAARKLEQRIQEATPRYNGIKDMFEKGGRYENTIPQYELLKQNGLLAEENSKIEDSFEDRRFRMQCGDQLTLLFDRVLADPDVDESLLRSILVAIGWAHNHEEEEYENEALYTPDNSLRSESFETMSGEKFPTRGGTDDQPVGDFEMHGEWERILYFLQLCHLLLKENNPSEFIDLLNRNNAQLLIDVGLQYAKDYVEKMLYEFPLILELAEAPKAYIGKFLQTGATTKNINLDRRKLKATNLSEAKQVYWC